MADYREPSTLGSTPGSADSASHSTHTNSTNTSGLVGRVREQATAQLATQKNKATDGLGSVAEAVRETTRHLREGQHDTVAHYAEQAADQIERFSQRLRNKDVGDLLNDAQQLARRKPALFVGGAFAIGLLGARFLKSSAPDGGGSYRSGEYASSGHSGSSSGIGQVANAYGNRVPLTPTRTTSPKPRAASTGTTRRPGNSSTEGL